MPKGKKKLTLTSDDMKEIKKEMKQEIVAHEKAESQLRQWAPATVTNSITLTPTIYGLNSAIVEGDGDDDRTGDSIRPQFLEYNMHVRATTAGTLGTCLTGRFLILRDKLADGNIPGGADIFEHSTDPLSVLAQQHMLNKPYRYTVLEDKLYRLVHQTADANRVFRGKIDLSKYAATKYISNSGTDASLGQGALIYVHISSAGANVQADFDYRLAYYDD